MIDGVLVCDVLCLMKKKHLMKLECELFERETTGEMLGCVFRLMMCLMDVKRLMVVKRVVYSACDLAGCMCKVL